MQSTFVRQAGNSSRGRPLSRGISRQLGAKTSMKQARPLLTACRCERSKLSTPACTSPGSGATLQQSIQSWTSLAPAFSAGSRSRSSFVARCRPGTGSTSRCQGQLQAWGPVFQSSATSRPRSSASIMAATRARSRLQRPFTGQTRTHFRRDPPSGSPSSSAQGSVDSGLGRDTPKKPRSTRKEVQGPSASSHLLLKKTCTCSSVGPPWKVKPRQ
mmetsp:Transcript_46615/g.148850  ORF Transcript_46615/g.148850 Transcript_46615/m.148850 type:complete len:215 (-) Transcript_46615:99-743(-)